MPLSDLSTPAAGIFPEFQHLELLAGQVKLVMSNFISMTYPMCFLVAALCQFYSPSSSVSQQLCQLLLQLLAHNGQCL